MSMLPHNPSPLAGEGGVRARQSVGGCGGASRLAPLLTFNGAGNYWLADASRPDTQPSPARGEGFETML
jgi:hypothetical protein